MNRAQLSHVLRAACQVTGDLPAPATASVEADVAFLDDPDDAKADQVDGAIGELSPFHEQYGYYAQGVSLSSAVLPNGWQHRLVRWRNQSTGQATPAFLEKHDLVVSKLVAFRDKDRAFADALIEADLVDVAVLRSRVDELPTDVDPRVVARIVAFLDRWT